MQRDALVCNALAGSADLTPTLLDLAGLPPIPGLQGDSMAGWYLRGDGPRNEAVWIGLTGWRAAWDGRYIYARGANYNHLYDHQTDPHEMTNCIKSPKHRKTAKRMHRLLLGLADKVEDPMLPKLQALTDTVS